MRLPEVRPRQPFIGVALSAVAGIGAADRWEIDPLWPLGVLAVLALALTLKPRTVVCWLFTTCAFFALHTLRFHGSAARELAGALNAGPRVVRAGGIVWSEPEKPAAWSRAITCHFRLKLESIEWDGGAGPADILVNVRWAGAVPEYGDRVALTGSASNLEPTRNPGQFDFTRYQQRQGVYSEIRAAYAADCCIESHGHGNAAQAFANRARYWIQRQLELDLSDAPELAQLVESMVLGMRGETPDDVRQLFQRTGTLHLFAVSGLNVAMLAAIGIFLLKPLGVRRGAAVLAIVPLLGGYALVTGLSASCIRAAIMGSLFLAGHLFDRRAVACNSLAAAAVAILAWDTNQLFVPGFQFSFTLVFVIVWLAARIQRRLERVARPDPFVPRVLWGWPVRGGVWCWSRLCGALGVTLSAWIGSLVFTAGYFHLFSPSALLANLFAVPIAFVVLALGIGAVLCAGFWSEGAVLFNNANWLAAKALLRVVNFFAAMPGGFFYVEVPSLGPRALCEFTALDVGDGAAIHLRAEGRDWLLDCGSAASYGRIVLSYLRTRGVNRLDGLLLTHGDAQHIGGALPALHDFAPRRIVDSPLRDRSATRRGIHAQLAARGIGKSIHWRGDLVQLAGGATLRVLFPPLGLMRAQADDKAFVLALESGGTRVLFMADSGFATEQWLLESEPDLRADLVVKGQHAKDVSGTAEFLARVQPQAVVCSALGFGQPPERLDGWERDTAARGIAVFRQDQCGAVHAEMRDGMLELRAFASGQTFRSRAR